MTLPLACTLTPDHIRCDADKLLPGLVAPSAGARWTTDGLQLVFAPTSESLTAIAHAIDRERKCCAFLEFTLTIPAGGLDFTLEIRGPAGTREFFEALDIVWPTG